LSWIEQEFGEYEPTVTAEFLQTASPAEILTKEVAHQARQVQIAAALANQFQVDVLAINLMLTDHANHKMPNMEQVEDAYCQADRDLRYLLDAFQPDNVLLISDHGSNRLKGDFLLDAWLRDQGYYVQVENGPTERLATFNWLLGQWLQKHHQWSGVAEKLCRHLIHRTFFRLPHWLQGQFWKRMEAILPFAREHVYFSNLPDYEHTVVFPGSTYAGLLYLHVAEGEFTGIAPPEGRESLKAEIAAKLLEVKEPKTGRPLFAHVYTAEELYTGPAVANAPDLILDSYDMGWNIRASKYASLPGPAHDQYFVETVKGRDFGWHSRDGIFVFSGPAFGAGPASGDGHLVDVPATLLHLHGVPIPEDYDGQVLTELMSAELRERPICYQPGDGTESPVADDTYSVKEAEEVLNHLRALGYVD
jgi:predicted AlkP superfamily phosphohydrolase/phosphomutase